MKSISSLKQNPWNSVDHDIQSVQGILSSIKSALNLNGDAGECFDAAYNKLEKLRKLAVTMMQETGTDSKNKKESP